MKEGQKAIRVAVIGAGMMGQVRAKAVSQIEHAEIVGVAARSAMSAQKLAGQYGCAYFDDYKQLSQVRPDALIIAVPHNVQYEIVTWGLLQSCHLLIGAPLATSLSQGKEIIAEATRKRLIIETGFEARYNPIWQTTKQLIDSKELGEITTVNSLAFWDAKAASNWYSQQTQSGGMPLTHMTYCFINPMRYVFGQPEAIIAMANKKHYCDEESVNEETCSALLKLSGDVPYTMAASFLAPSQTPPWYVFVAGTKGHLKLIPVENGLGKLEIYTKGKTEIIDFGCAHDPFVSQLDAFFATIKGENKQLNNPEDSLEDLAVIAALDQSLKTQSLVKVGS